MEEEKVEKKRRLKKWRRSRRKKSEREEGRSSKGSRERRRLRRRWRPLSIIQRLTKLCKEEVLTSSQWCNCSRQKSDSVHVLLPEKCAT